jgi:ribonuclease P protein component
VSRAVGKAVVRNRIKRRVREAVRMALPQLRSRLEERNLAAEIVFNPKKVCAEVEFAKLEAEVVRAFTAVGKAKGAAK